MRRTLIIVLACVMVIGLLAPAAIADQGGNPNVNASEQAVGNCFGQFRAEGAHLLKAAGFNLGWLVSSDTPQAALIHFVKAGGLTPMGAPCAHD